MDGSGNQVGTAPARGRDAMPRQDAERTLSDLAGSPVHLGDRVSVTLGPTTCPACGSGPVIWGCDDAVTQTRDEIHPLVWDEISRMADSFICRACSAGWVEPDEPEEIIWVRPFWVAGDGR